MKCYKEFNSVEFKTKLEDLKNCSYKVGKRTETEVELNNCCSNLIFTFDTETTSYFYKEDKKPFMFDYTKQADYYKDCKKQGLMYIWMFGIEEEVYYGRTNHELKTFISTIKHEDIKIIVYVHNLSFDFQFLLNALGTEVDIFCRTERKVMKAYFKEYNIEFRDSLILTNKKLQKAAEDLNCKHQKAVGDLAYNVMRTPLTPLTEEELHYCEFDCLCLRDIIEVYKKKYRTVENIPLTQTGQVRRQIKGILFKDSKHHELCSNIMPSSFKEYKELIDVYSGGYTHSNYLNTGKIIKNVYSYDITSSYPYVCCVEKLPMTKFRTTNKKYDEVDKNEYSVIVEFIAKNVRAKTGMSFLSVHRNRPIKYFDKDTQEEKELLPQMVVDNGRIRSSNFVHYKFVDTDYEIFKKLYDFDECIEVKVKIAKKKYLNKKIIMYILKLFNQKTQYKDVEGKEGIYRESKEYINSCYGMMATKVLTDDVDFLDGVWKTKDLTIEEADAELEKMANGKGNNLVFQWGVFIASLARKHLFDLITKIKDDVIYCDTDSIKFVNESNFKYFEEDNKIVEKKIKDVCFELDIDPALYKPKAPNGEESKLGYFTREYSKKGNEYDLFVTYGAKKYAYTYKNEGPEVHITVSGVNKAGGKALKSIEEFQIGYVWDYNSSGKMISYYIDNNEKITFEDGYIQEDKYSICLMPTSYILGITNDYMDLLDIEDAKILK